MANTEQPAQLVSGSSTIEPDSDDCPCGVCRSSSPNRDGPRVLIPVTPHADESLISLIARASARNWLPRLRSILSAITSTWHSHFNLAAREDIDFGQLAFACRLPAHDVESRRYRRIELKKTLPGVDFHGAIIPAYDVDLRSRRICPSWAKAGYHSAVGHHLLLTHCPASGEVLLEACPRCRRAFTWTKAAFHLCPYCDLSIADHKGQVVAPEIRAATQLILDVIHPERHSDLKLHPQLADINRGTIFELGWRMGCILTGRGVSRRDEASQLSFETRLKILAAGSTALAEWPNSVINGLKGLVGVAEIPCFALSREFRSIATAQNTWPELRDVMRLAAPFPRNVHSALKSLLVEGVNSREVEGVLGVSQRVVKRLRGTVDLTPVMGSGKVYSHQVFEASGLNKLRMVLEDRIEVAAIAERLDVSRHGVEQLACLGLLQIYDQGMMQTAFLTRQAKKSGFLQLFANLNECAAKDCAQEPVIGRSSRCPDSHFTVSIHAAMRSIGGREKPWGPAIVAMLSGDLAFGLDRSHERRFMSRVRIAAADLRKLAMMRFDEGYFPEAVFESKINGRDLEELLNIYPKNMQLAKRAGVIPKPINGLYDRETIRRLAREQITSPEILARCNGGTRKLPAAFKGREGNVLIQRSALGWIREMAEPAIMADDYCRRAKLRP